MIPQTACISEKTFACTTESFFACTTEVLSLSNIFHWVSCLFYDKLTLLLFQPIFATLFWNFWVPHMLAKQLELILLLSIGIGLVKLHQKAPSGQGSDLREGVVVQFQCSLSCSLSKKHKNRAGFLDRNS